MRRRGFFPKGQGVVSLTVKSLPPRTTLPPIVLERRRRRKLKEKEKEEEEEMDATEETVTVEISAFSAGDAVPEAAAQAASEACVSALLEAGAVASRSQISVSISRLRSPEEALGDGGGIIAVAKVKKASKGDGRSDSSDKSGGSLLLLGSAQPLSPPPKNTNKKQKTAATAATAVGSSSSSSSYSPAPASAAEVGAQVGRDLSADLASGAATDRWLQDQLIIFMALAKGMSKIETCSPITKHTRSAIAVAEAMTSARFRVVEEGQGLCRIECDGAGVEAHCDVFVG